MLLRDYVINIAELKEKYHSLDVSPTSNLSRQYNIVSAGLYNFLPEIPHHLHEDIFKNVLLHQRLSIDEVENPDILDFLDLQEPAMGKLEEFSINPAVFCTFHLGSYRLLNAVLAQKRIPFALVMAKSVLEVQGADIQRQYNRAYNNQPEEPLEIVCADEPSSALKMLRLLKKGKSLVVYTDGNTGAGAATSENENSTAIPFLGQQLMARSGFAILAHAAKVPMVPIISWRENFDKLVVKVFDPILPTADTDRNQFAIDATKKIYGIAADYIKLYPEQWEAWLYIHKVAKTSYQPVHVETAKYPDTKCSEVIFNSKDFGLFKIKEKCFLFQKSDFNTFPLLPHVFEYLNHRYQKRGNANGLTEDVFKELLNHVVIFYC